MANHPGNVYGMYAGELKITNSNSGKSLLIDDGRGNLITVRKGKHGLYLDDPRGHIEASKTVREFLAFADMEKTQNED